MNQDNVARLQQEGLVDPNELTKEHREALSRLSSEEIDHLISARQKLGFGGKLGQDENANVF